MATGSASHGYLNQKAISPTAIAQLIQIKLAAIFQSKEAETSNFTLSAEQHTGKQLICLYFEQTHPHSCLHHYSELKPEALEMNQEIGTKHRK